MNGDTITSTSQGDTTINRENEKDSGFYLSRAPVILAVLSILAVVFFLLVTGLSHVFFAQQESLGNRWAARGAVDLQQLHFEAAVSDFRTALLYSRGNYNYQLNLAEALMGLGRTSEAHAYFVNLWDREPENGLVNLDLARIAVRNREIDKALRYYHNAIYATWPGDQEVKRRDTRLELIEFLLDTNARAQAQSELIALAANLPDDPLQHTRAGELFFQAGDYEHALAEYSLSLKSEARNPAALAGAGLAAFELRRYALARHYLAAAVSANPNDAQNAGRLKTTELILEMDPFGRQMPFPQRCRIVIEDFTAAGARLKSCAAAGNAGGLVPSTSPLQTVAANWAKMKPEITEKNLRRNPDLVQTAMNLVFEIERQTNVKCGAPTGIDRALLLISSLPEGN
jgi:tetratricopeptide (TPR) repeat protein